ncbi:hypothetical protein AYO38_11725 [bacterium SCGC AG-212-C10]|nr:hypothetical protein AYO38_11725 [bacterium SCGC AG-212-C10]
MPSPSIQARDFLSNVAHVFGNACTFESSLTATDDDAGTASQAAAVIILGNATQNEGHGYWKNVLRYYTSGKGCKPAVTADRLACYLKIVSSMSRVFNEANDASTFQLAESIFDTSGKKEMKEIFDVQLLAVWLNFANGALDWKELVDTNGDKTPDTIFVDAVATIETKRLDPNTGRSQLEQLKSTLESWTSIK